MRTPHSCLAGLLALIATPAFAGSTCYELEDLPVYDDAGATYTGLSWWGVNNADVLVGDFCVDADCTGVRGVIYEYATGNTEFFDIDGYTVNIDSPRINDRGQISGSAMNAAGDWVSFVRDRDGTVHLIDIGETFIAQDINNRGQVAGFMPDAGWPFWKGAIVSGKDYDKVEIYEIEGAFGTALWSINDAGHVSPSEEGTDSPFGYDQAYDNGRTLEWLDWTDAGKDSYIAGTGWAINNRGQVAGALVDYPSWEHPGFVKTGDDWQIVWFGEEGRWTAVLDINDHGVIAGTYDGYDGGFVGFPGPCH